MDRTQALCLQYGRLAVTRVLREVLADVRSGIADGAVAHAVGADALVEETAQRLAKSRRLGLRRMINATGIVMHTNLGRAPAGRARRLPPSSDVARGLLQPRVRPRRPASAARARTDRAAAAHADRRRGGAGREQRRGRDPARASAPGAGREVIVSRGELVEIGGGFRIPDVIRAGRRAAGRGRLDQQDAADDYRAAIGPDDARPAQGAPEQLPHDRLHRRDRDRRAGRPRPRARLHVVADLGTGWSPPSPGWPSRPWPRRSPPAPTSSPAAATSCSAGRKPA